MFGRNRGSAGGADPRRRHERGLRSGTLPTHQIVGMGRGIPIAKEEMSSDNERSVRCATGCSRGCWTCRSYVNGDMHRRVPHNLNVSIQFRRGRVPDHAIKEVAVSSGSVQFLHVASLSSRPMLLRVLGPLATSWRTASSV